MGTFPLLALTNLLISLFGYLESVSESIIKGEKRSVNLNTVQGIPFNSFYAQDGRSAGNDSQALPAANDYDDFPTLKQLDQISLQPENTPRLTERSVTIAGRETAAVHDPLPSTAVGDKQASCRIDSRSWHWDQLFSDIDKFQPPAASLAEMVAHLERVLADDRPATSAATSEQEIGQAQSSPPPTDDSAPGRLPLAKPSARSQKPAPVKRCKGHRKSSNPTHSSYCLRSPRILKGMLKDGPRELYLSLMAMLKDTEHHGDAVAWIDKTIGLFAITDSHACTERLARLRGFTANRFTEARYSLRPYQKKDGTGILLPSRLVRRGVYRDMGNVFQWNLAHEKVVELMSFI